MPGAVLGAWDPVNIGINMLLRLMKLPALMERDNYEPYCNQKNVSLLLGESQIETIPDGVVPQRKLYLRQIRILQGITSKAMTPRARVNGFSLYRIRMDV